MGYSGGRLAPWFSRELVDNALVEMAEVGSHHLYRRIVDLTPVDTGILRASWVRTPLVILASPRGRIYSHTVETHVDYAPYVEHGTGLWGPKHAKYVIEPKRPDGYLHWISPGGLDVFAKRVMHPGSPGAHMVAIGVTETEGALDVVLAPVLEEWALRQERSNRTGIGRPNPPLLGRAA